MNSEQERGRARNFNMGSSQIYEKVKAEFDVEKENEIIEKNK